MTLAFPAALLLLLPMGVGAVLLWRGGASLVGGLPGDWDRLVDPALRAYLALGVAGRERSQILLAGSAAVAIVLALARPIVPFSTEPDYGNFVGRVLVMDMVAGVDPAPQRVLAERLIAGSPEIPTALVATTREAYDVVPLTTDPRHLHRYLAAIDPSLMPVSGRNPSAGVIQGESLLIRAGAVVGQVVFLPADAPEASQTAPPDAGGLRAILVSGETKGLWSDVADRWAARLAGADELDRIVDDLDAALRDAQLARAPEGKLDLRPWLTALAAALWLGLFRRRSAG